MTVYVDEAEFKKSPTGRKLYCHMIASTLDELHTFATTIDVKPHFFHSSSVIKHYDLTAEQRATAIEAGAVSITSRELVVLGRALQKPQQENL